MAVANAYPSSPAGLAARYYAAGVLAGLGRHQEAEARYQEVVARDGNSIYGRMAKLALVNVQASAGQYDSAIAMARELTTAQNDVPVDAVLMQLGRTYAMAGKTPDAVRAYTRVVDEFPQSLYVPDAKREIETLKGPAKPE